MAFSSASNSRKSSVVPISDQWCFTVTSQLFAHGSGSIVKATNTNCQIHSCETRDRIKKTSTVMAHTEMIIGFSDPLKISSLQMIHYLQRITHQTNWHILQCNEPATVIWKMGVLCTSAPGALINLPVVTYSKQWFYGSQSPPPQTKVELCFFESLELAEQTVTFFPTVMKVLCLFLVFLVSPPPPHTSPRGCLIVLACCPILRYFYSRAVISGGRRVTQGWAPPS